MATYPSQRHPSTAPLSRHFNRAAEERFVADWLGHVAAGRLGHLTTMSPAELAVQRANEMAVLGHAPSFAAPPAPRPAPRVYGPVQWELGQ